ncbi:MAG: hypothetical protein M3342_07205 [Bacteroidota bacterium]|nr:hypothetical protein [Bacteroidota bacterium]
MRKNVPGVRTFVLICTFLFLSFFSFSQSFTAGNGKAEIGIGLGPMFFLGDLGGNYGKGTTFIKDVNLPLTKLSKGLFINVFPAEWIGLRFAFNHSLLEGYDSIINDKGGAEIYRKIRNLQFRSQVTEFYGALELYPTVFMEQYDGLFGKLRPYGVIGAGLFQFNPKGKYYAPNGESKWVSLHDLHLEGQGMEEYPSRKNYNLTAFEIPMGFGAKYYLSENVYIGMEVLHRKTFTDYVDDVSTTYIDASLFEKYLNPQQAEMARQLYYRENFVPYSSTPYQTRPFLDEQRGDPKENDAFFSTIIRCGWRFNSSNGHNSRAARQLRCPTFY